MYKDVVYKLRMRDTCYIVIHRHIILSENGKFIAQNLNFQKID